MITATFVGAAAFTSIAARDNQVEKKGPNNEK